LPFLAPLTAAITGGVCSILDKVAINRQKISWHNFLVVVFFLLFAFTAILYPFWGWIKIEALEAKYLILFVAEIITSVGFNYYYYRSLEHQSLNEIEVSAMTAPIVRILLAALIFSSERNIHVFIAAIVASAALIFAHIERKHIAFDKYSIGMIFYLFFVACEALIIKELLDVYSPVGLYAIRCLIIFFVFAAMFKPKIENLNNRDWLYMTLVAIFAIPMMTLSYYGFYHYGIVYTTLILLLSPLIIFAGSALIFKEKIKKRIIIAAIVIIAAILYVNVMGYI